MIRELKSSHTYLKVMLLLSVLTLIFGFCFCFLGELFLPFAIAPLAALFIFENPKKRIFSYIVPIIPVITSILAFGIFAAITAQFVIYALIIALCYRYSKTKANASTYLTFSIAVILILSLYISGAMQAGSFSLESVTDYYSDVYTDFKGRLVDFIVNYTTASGEENAEKIISADVAGEYIDAASRLAVAFIGIFAFISAGIAIKFFAFLILRYSKNGILKSFAHFLPTNAVAYTYIVLSVLTAVIGNTEILDLSILNVCQILMIPFAYIGFQYILAVAKISGRKSTVLTFLFAGILALNILAIQLLSYLGVWITIGTNKSFKPVDEE